MTKLETAKQYFKEARGGSQGAMEALVELKAKSKCSWEKLELDKAEVEEVQQMLIKLAEEEAEREKTLEAEAEKPKPASTPKKPKPAKKPVNPSRGLISAMVRDLLENTDQAYFEIEAAVRAKFPEAKTTTRSIASTASEMRKKKIDVAIRRPAAKEA